MTENEEFEDYDEESQEWSPEWYPFPEDQDKLVEKKWVRYQGPLGGTGWQSTKDPKIIRYQEEMPHEKEEGEIPLKSERTATFDNEEMMERYARRWLEDSPKGSKIYITKLAAGEEYVHDEGFKVELFYPPIRNLEDMLNQAWQKLKDAWRNPKMASLDRESREEQEHWLKWVGMNNEEARALMRLQSTWTKGMIKSMRNTLAAIETGVMVEPSRDTLFGPNERAAFKKWRKEYFNFVQHIVKDAMKDRAKGFTIGRRAVDAINEAIDETGIELYRGLKIEQDKWEKLKESKDLGLIINNLDSWSADVNVATSFTGGLKKGKIPIVLKYRAGADEIANGWPFVGYITEAEFILNLSQDNKYEVIDIESQGAGVSQRYVVSLMRQSMSKKQDILTLDLTGDNDWADIRDKEGRLGKRDVKVKETEEVVVATFSSTPWSNDKPPRPDRKKKKVVIAEYIEDDDSRDTIE